MGKKMFQTPMKRKLHVKGLISQRKMNDRLLQIHPFLIFAYFQIGSPSFDCEFFSPVACMSI